MISVFLYGEKMENNFLVSKYSCEIKKTIQLIFPITNKVNVNIYNVVKDVW